MFSFFLETEPKLKLNLTVSGVAAATAAKAETSNRVVLTETRRAEIVNRTSEVRAIKQIADLYAERQIVRLVIAPAALSERSAAAASAAAGTSAADTWNSSGIAASSRSARSSCGLSAIGRVVRGAFARAAKAECLIQIQINPKEIRTASVIARDNLVWVGNVTEIAKRIG